MASADKPSLYERLGGVYSIISIVDDFINRKHDRPETNFQLPGGRSASSGTACGIQVPCDRDGLLGCGRPQKYTGKSMAESHKDLTITSKEWEAFLDDFQQTLDKFAVPAEELAELKTIVNSTRSEIVVDSCSCQVRPHNMPSR